MEHITKISFPGLGIDPFSISNVAFTILGIDIYWYAIIITFGMVCAVAYATLQSKKIGVTFDDICDFALWTIPIGIIGARLYYVLTSLEKYDSLGDALNIRDGGLAIYGGILAGAATVFVVSKVKKIDFLALADCVAPGVLLAQGIGRWGNFMNGEAFGGLSDGFLRMGIDNYLSWKTFGVAEMVYVHPTFLYESLWNLLGVLLVYLFSRYIHKKYDGQLFIMTFGWYGLGRMFIEGLRMDSLMTSIFGIEFRTSQVLAATIFTICLALYIYFAIKKPTKPLFQKELVEAAASDEQEENADEIEEIEEDFVDEAEDLFEESTEYIEDAEESIIDDSSDLDDVEKTEETLENQTDESIDDTAEEVAEEVSSSEKSSDIQNNEEAEFIVEEQISKNDEENTSERSISE